MACVPEALDRRIARALADHPPTVVTEPGARAAAVLIPIVAGPEPTLLLTVRSDSLSSHRGQIAFPGGSLDPGESAAEAALREAHEEIGLDPSTVTLLGELDTFPTFVSGFVVTPFVGWIDDMPELEPNPREVADVLAIPLGRFTDEIRREPGFAHLDRTYPTEAWVWRDHVVWGVTARIMRSFLERLAAAGLAAPPGETRSWVGPPPTAEAQWP